MVYKLPRMVQKLLYGSSPACPSYGPDVFVHLGANSLAEYARNNLVFMVQVYKPTQAIIINTGTLKTKTIKKFLCISSQCYSNYVSLTIKKMLHNLLATIKFPRHAQHSQVIQKIIVD